MKKTIILSLVSVFSVLPFTSCKVEVIDKNQGPIKASTVNAKDFDGIAISYPAEVTYIPSETFSVEVKAPEKVKENMIIKVKDGVLQISPQEMWGKNKRYLILNGYSNNNEDVKITVKAPTIKEVSIAGSGDFKCNSTMKTTKLVLSVAGSGDIDIKNIEAQFVSASIAGSGDIDAGLTKVAKTEASIAGSGDIDMKFSDCGHVEANLSGSGDIELSGDIKSLSKNIMGSGDFHTDKLRINRQ